MNEERLIALIREELKNYISKGVKKTEISYLGEDKILREEIEKYFCIVECGEKLVVSGLKIKQLIELSNGSHCDDESRQILQHILENREVFLVEEGIEWRAFENIPIKLRENYLQKETILKSYGVKILKRLELVECLKGKKNYFTGRILDLRELKNITLAEKELVVSNNTRMTELAKEYAREKGIKIIKR